MAHIQVHNDRLDTVAGVESTRLQIRTYQKEMFDKSMRGNIIVAMDTGSGKTAIAVLRIHAELDTCPPDKCIWFLAPTVALCTQQHEYIRSHLPAVKARLLIGSDNVDRWSEQRTWDAALDNVRVVVSTYAVLADALGHGFIKMSQLALLIFDEAHHCARAHAANVIMKDFYHPMKTAAGSDSVPHILGLSASPILRSKITELRKIESNLDSISVTPRLHRQDMLRYVHHPEIQRLEYNPIDEQESSATSDMLQTLRRLHQQILMQQRQIGDIVVPTAKNSMGQRTSRTQRAPAWLDQLTKLHSKATHIYEELGAWAADHFISQTVELFKAKADLTTSFSYLPSPGDRTRSRLLQILDQADFTQPVKALSVLCPISTKVEQLLAYLERQDSRECSGLIFVQQRATVSVLCAILSTHPRIEGRFRCATFVGQSSSAQKQYNISEIFDYRAQKETMAAFRSGKRNLVIATDALEEGIDIAACNLVVCFNLPPSLKSFIQRRGRARMERSKFAIMLPNNSDRSKIDAWKELEKELIRAYQDEQRARIQAASIEQQEEVVDYRLQVKTTGATLTAEKTLAHVYHFCATLPLQPYVEMQPEFSFDEDNSGFIACTVTLPNCIDSSLRSVRGKKGWKTERAAMKDAAFQCYTALFQSGLLNDNLLPLTHDWRDQLGQPEELPSVLMMGERVRPFAHMASTWPTPDLHQVRITVQRESQNTHERLLMVLTVPVRIPHVPPIILFWDAENTFKVTLGDPVRSASLTPDLLEHLRASTQLLHRSTHSDHNTHNSSDFVALFGPDVADHQLSNWVIANQGRRGVLDVPGAGRTKLDGFIRSPLLHGSPHIFCGWRRNFGAENEGDLDIDCIPLLKRRNFEVPNTLAARSTILDDDPNDASHTLQFHARDCTVDHLDMKYAVFSLFIPSILRHIEAYCVADQLQKTILQQVQFQDAGNIVTAITAPSASWTTNYQRYEFIGDAVLKFQTSVQLYSDHGNWPEGYLSQRRDSLVSNANLARAALSIKLDQYILTDAPRRKGWSPPRISDVKLCEEERKLGRKILADVIEALIGAAFIDGGLGAARSCINIFIPEIRVGKPEISIFLPNHKNSTGEPETELLIGYQFRNQALLLEALTHPTCDTDTNTESYQRLEFLGDAVLDVLICRSLSQCQPELTQGQMTRIKGALANSGLLGFLCLSFSKDRIDVRIEESGDCKFTEVRSVEKVPLWKFMRHHSVDVVQAQVDCSERYRKYGAEIQSCLSKGECYPWVLLARLNPEKFYSDMIESIIGAIFVDSQGDLSECQQFFDRIGLGLFASRMASGRLDVVHPRDKLQRVAGSSKVDIHVESVGSDTACFRCTIKIDGSVHAEVDGCMTKEEACVSGADAAVALLSSMQEHARRAVLRSSCGQSPYPTRSA